MRNSHRLVPLAVSERSTPGLFTLHYIGRMIVGRLLRAVIEAGSPGKKSGKEE
jgi:hypothetical protein